VAKVINLDDHRDHLTIVDTEGEAHTIPVSFFDSVAAGRVSIDNLGSKKEKLLPVIIGEWVRLLREKVG
jgi:hypothetical protein